MRVKIKNILVLMAIYAVFAAILTNPKKEVFLTWGRERLVAQATNAAEQQVIALYADAVIKNTTKAHNYVLFTIYDTTILDTNIRYIGAFNTFLQIREQPAKQNIKQKI